MNIGVYKTDVGDKSEANVIKESINREFPDCDVHFDLDDCDNVLRIESGDGKVSEEVIGRILKKFDRQMDPLPM